MFKFQIFRQNFLENRKKVLITFFSVMFMVYCGTFGIIDFFIDRIIVGIVLIITTFINVLAYYFCKKDFVKLGSRSILTAGLILYSFLFFDGGIEKTGILWVFTYPNFSFYLGGRKEGMVWIGLLFMSVLTITVLAQTNLYSIKFNYKYVLIGATIYILVTILAYFHEFTRQRFEETMNEKNQQLSNSNVELKKRDKIINTDLKLSKRIQNAIIDCDETILKHLKIVTHFEPMMHVGGDIYDICKLKHDTFRFFLADATGHGVQAALMTMIIKNEYDKLKLNYNFPDELLFSLNNNFINKYFSLTVFFTCIVVDINVKANSLMYSSAGHFEQFIIKNSKIIPLNAKGKMIGLDNNLSYELIKKQFNAKDKLLLFTDGIFEEFSEDGKELGEKGLYKIIVENQEMDITSLTNRLITEVTSWRGDNNVNDDITLIGVEYN